MCNGCKTERKPLVCKWCSGVFVPQGRGPQKYCSIGCASAKRDDDRERSYRQALSLLPMCATSHCQSRVWRGGETHCKVCSKRAEKTGSVEKLVWCAGGCGKLVDRVAKKTLRCDECFRLQKRLDGEKRRERICEVCGKQFIKKMESETAGRACSRECGWKLQSLDKTEQKAATALRRSNATASKRMASLKPCVICSQHFVAKGMVLTCSQACKREHEWRKTVAVHNGSYEAWLNKKCSDCGDLVEARSGKFRKLHKAQYCRLCINARKRASAKVAKFNRRRLQNGVTAKHPTKEVLKGIAEMIRKAGNRCPLCGLMMTKGCEPNNNRHIELDHRVPLSQGGADTFDNLRAICRKCNGLKSAFTAPELILLPTSQPETLSPVVS